MKIGILSDTHGFIHPQIIQLMNGCDIIIHAGDIIEQRTLKLLQPKQKLVAIQGNNDSHLTQLKTVENLNLASGKIIIEHGHQHGWHTPSHTSLRVTYPDARVIIYGHTHKQVIDKGENPWVINPGAAGKIRNYGSAKCLLLDASDTKEWEINPYLFSYPGY